MFVMFAFQLLAFVLEPITRPGTFRMYLESMWYCWSDTDSIKCDPSSSNVIFIIHTLILRIAIPLLLLHVVLSFTPKSSHSAQIMHYRFFYEIISPVTVIIICVLAFFSNYFTVFSGTYGIVTCTYIGIVIILALWQIYLFVRLLNLAEVAENDQEQFHAYLAQSNANLFNYFSKGIIYSLLWAVEFVCLYSFGVNGSTNERTLMVYRQIPSMIFAVTSIFMLVPLQKVAINPSYNELIN